MQQIMIYWQSIIPQHVSDVFTPIIRRAVCEEDVAWQATSSSQCTHLATQLSGTTTATARTDKHKQWHAVCSPDDGRKNARNMLRNNWLPINHYLLHQVGLAFICFARRWILDRPLQHVQFCISPTWCYFVQFLGQIATVSLNIIKQRPYNGDALFYSGIGE
jgi:hypothetical protein